MAKEIICVYQDCVMCGDRGKKLKQFIVDKGLNVRKVSFASPEGEDLCHKAVFEHGIGKMPFFTDGTKFSSDIKEILKRTPAKKAAAKKKTTKKVRIIDEPKENNYGSISES